MLDFNNINVPFPAGCFEMFDELYLNNRLNVTLGRKCSTRHVCLCYMCPPGTYRRLPVAGNPGDKYEVCDTCDYGKYQDEFAQNECKQCGPGQYQDQSKRAASQVPGMADVEIVDMTTSFMDASNRDSVLCRPIW